VRLEELHLMPYDLPSSVLGVAFQSDGSPSHVPMVCEMPPSLHVLRLC
jgi:hypothetical protein